MLAPTASIPGISLIRHFGPPIRHSGRGAGNQARDPAPKHQPPSKPTNPHPMPPTQAQLTDPTLPIAVIGLGDVGLPLAVDFGKQRPVIGKNSGPSPF